MSSPAPEEDERSTGYDYEPGLQIATSLLENQGHEDWQVDALCHEQYDVFDLVTDPEGRARGVELRAENNYRGRAAQRICFECPVFQQCYDATWQEPIIPVGVCRAGAKLSSPFQKVREKALLKSYAAWLGYQSRKRTQWKREQKLAELAQKRKRAQSSSSVRPEKSSKRASTSPKNRTPSPSSPPTRKAR